MNLVYGHVPFVKLNMSIYRDVGDADPPAHVPEVRILVFSREQ